jgi:hypothetical protein
VWLIGDWTDSVLPSCFHSIVSVSNFYHVCHVKYASLSILRTPLYCRQVDIWDRPCTSAEIGLFQSFFDGDAKTKRKGIPGTLHRVSLITHPLKQPVRVLGVAVRVGRALQGLIETMIGGVRYFYFVKRILFSTPVPNRTRFYLTFTHRTSIDYLLISAVIKINCCKSRNSFTILPTNISLS